MLGTLIGLEAIFDVVPDGWESKVLAACAVCGSPRQRQRAQGVTDGVGMG